ncbi:hypothetical protein [Bdellovibrio bacteriovorus]|uniref:hypothetical protein n=1 Tax=Bdellovibrio bacteriovorus TaxID=959 RepID=UPI0035A735D2
MKKSHFKIIICSSLLWLSACSFEASISGLESEINPSLDSLQRKQPDFVSGEVVTTSSGVVITGTFGEISETKKVSPEITIQGAFYE